VSVSSVAAAVERMPLGLDCILHGYRQAVERSTAWPRASASSARCRRGLRTLDIERHDGVDRVR